MEAVLTTIIGDIETGIRSRLEKNGLQARFFSITDDPEAVVCPAVNVSFIDGRCARVTQESWKMHPARFRVIVLVRNLKSEEDRRRAVYPLIMGVLGILSGKVLTVQDASGAERTIKMGALQPGNVTEVYESDSRLGYAMEFDTVVTFPMMDDEQAGALVTASLKYLLKPGDDTEDAEDIVTMEQ